MKDKTRKEKTLKSSKRSGRNSSRREFYTEEV